MRLATLCLNVAVAAFGLGISDGISNRCYAQRSQDYKRPKNYDKVMQAFQKFSEQQKVRKGADGITVGESVVTMLPSLGDLGKDREVIVLAGTQLTVSQIQKLPSGLPSKNGSPVIVIAAGHWKGQPFKIVVPSTFLRTESSLKWLQRIDDGYAKYTLFRKRLPTRVDAVSCRQTGMFSLDPASTLENAGDGTMLSSGSELSKPQQEKAATAVKRHIKKSLEQTGLRVKDDSPWQLLVVGSDVLERSSISRMMKPGEKKTVPSKWSGDLFLLNVKEKTLLCHLQFHGKGATVDSLTKSFAENMAKAFVVRWRELSQMQKSAEKLPPEMQSTPRIGGP